MKHTPDFTRTHNWGKSMYGGWYVNLWSIDGYCTVCFHFDKLSDLRIWAARKGVDLCESIRIDN